MSWKVGEQLLILGHSPKGGVDIWSEELAEKMQIPIVIFQPKFNNWKSYKERNIQIATNCELLFDFEPEGRKKSGGMWTLDYAKSIGRQVMKIEVS